MSASTLAAVRIEAADKVYPNGVRALEPIDLTIDEGEFVTLLGPSGCGKSTLLRMIAGLSAPSSGSVQLFAGLNPGVRRGDGSIAFVFQQPTLMPWASVERNVRLPLDLTGSAGASSAARVRETLRLVGLSDFASAYPRQLSGGMQMRASIARALVTEPHLLLMDEPFGALDEITRNRLDRDVRELWARRKLTVIFVTHSIYEAVFLSTRVLVMSPRPGRIVGELEIDPAQPRNDEFRLGTQFAAWCKRLSGMLDESSRSVGATA